MTELERLQKNTQKLQELLNKMQFLNKELKYLLTNK